MDQLLLVSECIINFIALKYNLSGDAEHHKMVFHPAMVLHLFICICVLLGPLQYCIIINSGLRGLDTPDIFRFKKHAVAVTLLIVFTAIITLSLIYGSLEHDFLLADNRYL
jgi:hypothetical protein